GGARRVVRQPGCAGPTQRCAAARRPSRPLPTPPDVPSTQGDERQPSQPSHPLSASLSKKGRNRKASTGADERKSNKPEGSAVPSAILQSRRLPQSPMYSRFSEDAEGLKELKDQMDKSHMFRGGWGTHP